MPVDLLTRSTLKRLKRLTRRHPAAGLRATAAAGYLLGAESEWAPTRDALLALLPEADAQSARRRIAANALRNVVFGSLVHRRGLAALADRVEVRGEQEVLELHRGRSGCVILFAHIGAARSVALALEKLGVRARVGSAHRIPKHTGHVLYEPVTSTADQTRFLRRSLADLDSGIAPLVSVDSARGEGPSVPFWGRSARAARGVAVLARRGATVVPAFGRWTGLAPRIEVTFLPPLPGLRREADADEEARFLRRCLSWIEEQVRLHPDLLRPLECRTWAELPAIDSSGNR